MYQKRFGLHRKPFQSVQNDCDYFPSETYKKMLPAVLNALQSDLGIAVLTGPSGVGKTVTLESFRRALESNTQTIFIRGGTIRSAEDLLYALHRHLLKAGQDDSPPDTSRKVRRWDVVERLQRLSEFWGPLTMLVDDVHLVEVDVFAELRAILEEGSTGQKLARLMIAGPLCLEEVLAQPSMGDFAQKIRTHVFLEPLRTTESVDYLAHQVSNAGGTIDNLFSAKAIEKIVVAADGMPRCLNLLADEALVICEETDQPQVSPEIVQQALSRLQHLPVTWNSSADTEELETHSADYDHRSESSHSNSVVEIGSTTEEVSHGVIEFGAPGPESESPVGTQETHEILETPEDTVFESDDADSTCCEFIADDDLCRDSEVVEHIADISQTLESVDSDTCEFGFTDNLNDAEEVSVEQFMQTDNEQDEAEPFDDIAASSEHTGEESHIDEELPVEPKDAIDANFDNLEHHLLLAASGSSVDEDELNCDSDLQMDNSEEDNEHLFDAILARSNPLDDYETFFPAYVRWEPAGTWAPVMSADRTEPALYATQLGDAAPVFDRYTWCDLGRTVSAEPLSRRNTVSLATTPPEWPPITDGVAPFEPIAVHNAEDSHQDLLPDLRAIVGQTFETENPDAKTDFLTESDTAFHEAGDSLTLSDLSTSLQEPESDDRQFDTRTFIETSEPSENTQPTAETEGLSSNDEQPVPEAESAETDNVVALTFPSATDTVSEVSGVSPVHTDSSSERSEQPIGLPAPADSEHVGQSSQNPETLEQSSDVAALIANAVERFISESTPQAPPEGAKDAVIADREEQELSIDEYAPKLLQEARARVTSVLAAQSELRQAAGAEYTSYPVNAPGATDKDEGPSDPPYLSISRIDENLSETPESETADLPRETPRFRDLFTRLRRLSGRSA